MRQPCRMMTGPNFNPRSPCGERLTTLHVAHGEGQFQSTLSLRRATAIPKALLSTVKISIHALLAESDRHVPLFPRQGLPISIHALLAESDLLLMSMPEDCVLFQSTLSLRRATIGCVYPSSPMLISIHALLAESDRFLFSIAIYSQISIHALLAESD